MPVCLENMFYTQSFSKLECDLAGITTVDHLEGGGGLGIGGLLIVRFLPIIAVVISFQSSVYHLLISFSGLPFDFFRISVYKSLFNMTFYFKNCITTRQR